MKLKIATTFAVLFAVHGMSDAATIAFNKGLALGFNVKDTTGAAIASTAFFGTFAGGTAPTTPGNGDYTSIISSFNVYGTGISVSSGVVLAGNTSNSAANTAIPTTFNTFTIYCIVANNATLSLATQFALVDNTTASFFPADITAAGSTNFTVGALSTIQPVAGAGSLTAGTVSPNYNSINMVHVVTAIPETSSALLGAFGVLGLLRRRRN